jgi:hypothetical protein
MIVNEGDGLMFENYDRFTVRDSDIDVKIEEVQEDCLYKEVLSKMDSEVLDSNFAYKFMTDVWSFENWCNLI